MTLYEICNNPKVQIGARIKRKEWIKEYIYCLQGTYFYSDLKNFHNFQLSSILADDWELVEQENYD